MGFEPRQKWLTANTAVSCLPNALKGIANMSTTMTDAEINKALENDIREEHGGVCTVIGPDALKALRERDMSRFAVRMEQNVVEVIPNLIAEIAGQPVKCTYRSFNPSDEDYIYNLVWYFAVEGQEGLAFCVTFGLEQNAEIVVDAYLHGCEIRYSLDQNGESEPQLESLTSSIGDRASLTVYFHDDDSLDLMAWERDDSYYDGGRYLPYAEYLLQNSLVASPYFGEDFIPLMEDDINEDLDQDDDWDSEYWED